MAAITSTQPAIPVQCAPTTPTNPHPPHAHNAPQTHAPLVSKEHSVQRKQTQHALLAQTGLCWESMSGVKDVISHASMVNTTTQVRIHASTVHSPHAQVQTLPRCLIS